MPDPRDAEDILQEVFYELVEANRRAERAAGHSTAVAGRRLPCTPGIA